MEPELLSATLKFIHVAMISQFHQADVWGSWPKRKRSFSLLHK